MEPPLSPKPTASARRRVTIAMGSLAAVAVLVSLGLLALIADVAAVVASMQQDEQAMHEGLMLGIAVREQYIHEAHTLIERNQSHLDHHHTWVEEVARSAALLHERVPASERWRVQRIADTSTEIDEAFRSTIVPAMAAGDLATVRTEHRRIDALVTRAAGDADAVAAALEHRMHDEHTRAEGTAQAAVAIAALGALLALFLAGYHGARVRRRVLGPLGELVDLTREIGEGRIPKATLEGDAEVVAVGVALKQLASDLHEREGRLVASERLAAVGQLAAGVAHEVNNPIGIIRGYLRTMIPEARDAQLKDELRILDEEAHACQRIAEDLVAFARASELRVEEVELASVIGDIAQRLEASGELHGARVRVDAEPCAMSVDAGRIRQVVSNLVRNAAVAAPEGLVEVVGIAEADAYRIEVRDRGPGVDEAERDRIFEPFFGKRPGGSGLGLAVCIGVVRAHGGSIRAAARDGGGATFVVELPRARERLAA